MEIQVNFAASHMGFRWTSGGIEELCHRGSVQQRLRYLQKECEGVGGGREGDRDHGVITLIHQVGAEGWLASSPPDPSGPLPAPFSPIHHSPRTVHQTQTQLAAPQHQEGQCT